MFKTIKSSMISRRDALKLCGGALINATVFGCGSNKTNSTKIQFMTALTWEKHRSLEPLLNEFSAIYPSIQIEHIKVPWDQAHSKYITAILGGSPPDVMMIPSWWVAEFRAMGALEDLSPWVKDWPYLNGYAENVKRFTEATLAFDGDQIFGLPS